MYANIFKADFKKKAPPFVKKDPEELGEGRDPELTPEEQAELEAKEKQVAKKNERIQASLGLVQKYNRLGVNQYTKGKSGGALKAKPAPGGDQSEGGPSDAPTSSPVEEDDKKKKSTLGATDQQGPTNASGGGLRAKPAKAKKNESIQTSLDLVRKANPEGINQYTKGTGSAKGGGKRAINSAPGMGSAIGTGGLLVSYSHRPLSGTALSDAEKAVGDHLVASGFKNSSGGHYLHSDGTDAHVKVVSGGASGKGKWVQITATPNAKDREALVVDSKRPMPKKYSRSVTNLG